MKRINFLEVHAFQITYRRMLMIFVLCGAIAGAGFGFFHFRNMRMGHHVKSISGEISTMKGEQAKLMKELDAAKELANQKSLKELQEEFTVLPSWVPLLREVASKMPPDLWLTGLEGKREGDSGNPSLLLQGITSRTARLTEFIHRLGKGVYVQNPSLGETHVTVLNGRAAYEFTIDCEVVPL